MFVIRYSLFVIRYSLSPYKETRASRLYDSLACRASRSFFINSVVLLSIL